MPPFDELAGLAKIEIQALHQTKQDCRKAAESFCRGWDEYLGCPPEQLQYCALNPDLSTIKVMWCVKGKAHPGLTQSSEDGYYYFAMELTVFEDSQGYVRFPQVMGIEKVDDSSYRLHFLGGEAKSTFDPAKPESMTKIYAMLFDALRESFAMKKKPGSERGIFGIVHQKSLKGSAGP